MPAIALNQDDVIAPAEVFARAKARKEKFFPKPAPKIVPEAVEPANVTPTAAEALHGKIDSAVEALQAKIEELESAIDVMRGEWMVFRRASFKKLFTEKVASIPMLKLEHIIAIVARYYGYRSIDLKCARRQAVLITPRHVAMYLCCDLTAKSLPEIGRHFGGRDHTTIIHGRDKITLRMRDDQWLCYDVAVLELVLLGKRTLTGEVIA